MTRSASTTSGLRPTSPPAPPCGDAIPSPTSWPTAAVPLACIGPRSTTDAITITLVGSTIRFHSTGTTRVAWPTMTVHRTSLMVDSVGRMQSSSTAPTTAKTRTAPEAGLSARRLTVPTATAESDLRNVPTSSRASPTRTTPTIDRHGTRKPGRVTQAVIPAATTASAATPAKRPGGTTHLRTFTTASAASKPATLRTIARLEAHRSEPAARKVAPHAEAATITSARTAAIKTPCASQPAFLIQFGATRRPIVRAVPA